MDPPDMPKFADDVGRDYKGGKGKKGKNNSEEIAADAQYGQQMKDLVEEMRSCLDKDLVAFKEDKPGINRLKLLKKIDMTLRNNMMHQ